MGGLRQFLVWLDRPIEEVTSRAIADYIDSLMAQKIKPKTINCHLGRVCQFYHYLIQEENLQITNPVKPGARQRMPNPLPRHLTDQQTRVLFSAIKNPRDRAIFTLMLRCGLRVGEVAGLLLTDIDPVQKRLFIHDGKWQRDRVVYLSDDAAKALSKYLKIRPEATTQRIFLVQKGTYQGLPLSIRGIQKRMEYYAKKTQINASCHHLRHTMATQMLNADAQLETIQDLLGHRWITTTQRYCRLSNLKVQRDYFRAIKEVMRRTTDSTFRLDQERKS
jgi:site-specific recombinase XerD